MEEGRKYRYPDPLSAVRVPIVSEPINDSSTSYFREFSHSHRFLTPNIFATPSKLSSTNYSQQVGQLSLSYSPLPQKQASHFPIEFLVTSIFPWHIELISIHRGFLDSTSVSRISLLAVDISRGIIPRGVAAAEIRISSGELFIRPRERYVSPLSARNPGHVEAQHRRERKMLRRL